jgi:UDP-N-acetyl-D-mannosaminuronic acid dehydrogenase
MAAWPDATASADRTQKSSVISSGGNVLSLQELGDKIRTRSSPIGVVGLGYVGLAVACKVAEAGFNVRGVDIVADKVADINAGISPIQGREPGLSELVHHVTQDKRLTASTDAATLRTANVILIAVETPVEAETKLPKYKALRAALTSVGKVLQRGTLVIVESTIAPMTMTRLVAPTLESASGLKIDHDFYLGHCPERVMPGRLLQNLSEMSRVCGGSTPETAEVMAEFYRHIVKANLDCTDMITAEIVKTAENAYRDVQIAFANELALICESAGTDVWRVRDLVNKSPGRNVHLPGAGVGGHCIPKDPWLLVSSMAGNRPARLIPTARAVNDSMPQHMVELVQDALGEVGVALENARVAVLGYAYLENSDDTRNSPSQPLVDLLRLSGAEVTIHDPYVPEYQGELTQMIRGTDALVVMVRHDQYLALNLTDLKPSMRHSVIVDGRHVFDPLSSRQAGFIFRGVGRGERTA